MRKKERKKKKREKRERKKGDKEKRKGKIFLRGKTYFLEEPRFFFFSLSRKLVTFASTALIIAGVAG